MSVTREEYKYFSDITTRWSDNDIYGHVNNVTYYSYFDTVANNFLIERAGLDIHAASVVGFVVASECQYHSPVAYPERLEAGFRVNRIGNRSVEYGIAIFQQGSKLAAASGSFTHVFVNRQEGKSVAIPEIVRQALLSVTI
ncbi:acyl-CoA thioesterase [Arenicella xantha]|uniref:Acyl-CoA thioester hydrolase n=1 Tax=Arenicella xantha TaxID=644221 RepID=A0A395JFX3_9GAMM|nr:thioesterase family protein [Arenicella xantha]RBP48321.1 acyl-CoA thioester hydrolase [Arenicella xantha]